MPELNLVAVAVAAVVLFVVSTLYYMVFTSQLKQLSPAYADAEARPPAWKIAAEIARSFVVGMVVAGLASAINVTDIGGAVLLGVALWVGFPAVLLTGSVIWEKVPLRLAAIHAGDWLLKLLIVTTMVTIWR